MFDPHAAMKDITRARSSGYVTNKHAVRAPRTTQPDYEKMRRMSQPDPADPDKKEG